MPRPAEGGFSRRPLPCGPVGIPSIPGVNVAGDYKKDFAADPWGWMMAEWKRIQEGTYQYFVEDYSLGNKQVAQNAGQR